MPQVLTVGSVGFVIQLRTTEYIPPNATAYMRVARPDGEYFNCPAVRIADRTAQVTLHADDFTGLRFTMSGRHRIALVVDTGPRSYISRPVNLDVEALEPAQ